MLGSFRVSEIHESVQEKNELNIVPGTAPVADGKTDEQRQLPVIMLIYVETHTHTLHT